MNLNDQLDKFFVTKEEQELPYVPFETINKELKKRGWKQCFIESNGWQADFWCSYEKPGEPSITVGGSWYYGQYTIYIEDIIDTDE